MRDLDHFLFIERLIWIDRRPFRSSKLSYSCNGVHARAMYHTIPCTIPYRTIPYHVHASLARVCNFSGYVSNDITHVNMFILCRSSTDIYRTHHTIPYHTIPYHAMPYRAIRYHATPYHTMSCDTIRYHAIPCHTIPYHTILPTTTCSPQCTSRVFTCEHAHLIILYIKTPHPKPTPPHPILTHVRPSQITRYIYLTHTAYRQARCTPKSHHAPRAV